MLIDLEELAGNIASKVDGARLTPVIEKEIVHYEIIRSLGRNDLLRDITFQGGTSLRLCYGSLRYSEDLDFVAGDKFDSLPLDDFSKTLRSDLLKSYDTEVSVREPKVVNDFDGVGMRRWTVSVNTNIARPDLPKQRIKLEIASVPAHTSTIRRVAVNYPELDGMYDNLTIRCQTLEEILADKLISFSATDTHIRHRDLWDIPWIVRAQEIDFSAVAALVATEHVVAHRASHLGMLRIVGHAAVLIFQAALLTCLLSFRLLVIPDKHRDDSLNAPKNSSEHYERHEGFYHCVHLGFLFLLCG